MATPTFENADTSSRKRKADASSSSSCPYLDTVQRVTLDFDFEPVCSVSLSANNHIYGCLCCGKYFRGRGPQTPAYTHSVEESHFVFVHLAQGTFHCLPDDYEINDPSLEDIRAALHPTFSREQIAAIDTNTELSRDLFGRPYLPGFVGLNNLHKTDCINAVAQALAHVPPLRDYFLKRKYNESLSMMNRKKKGSNNSSMHRNSLLVTHCFGELVRKLWSDCRFKSHVDPHQFVQAIAAASHKRFQVGQQAEAGEFMAWLLNQLHIGTGGTRKAGSSIVHQVFQGKVRVTTQQARRKQVDKAKEEEEEEDDRGGSDEEIEETVDQPMKDAEEEAQTIEETVTDSHFLQLTLDIPEKPLFRDEDGGLVIPQEPLSSVLKKFNGVSFIDVVNQNVSQRKKYQLLKLPNYLILHLARFKTNRYSREKNPTIVAFPVKNLDLGDYVFPPQGKQVPPTEADVRKMNVKELTEMLTKYGQTEILKGAVEKQDLVETAVDFVATRLPDLLAEKYDLVANITHESPAEVGREGKHDPLQEGSYKCHVQHRATSQWYEMQDLHVQEIMPQQIGLSESYVLIFERKSAQAKIAK